MFEQRRPSDESVSIGRQAITRLEQRREAWALSEFEDRVVGFLRQQEDLFDARNAALTIADREAVNDQIDALHQGDPEVFDAAMQCRREVWLAQTSKTIRLEAV